MIKVVALLLCSTTSQLMAMPKFYEGFAAQNNIQADALFAVALSEAGVTNEYGHSIPWPWTASVNGNYFQFKTKQELFVYLQQNRHTQNITYGLAGRPLTFISDQNLWENLAVENNLQYIANKLKNIQCNYLSQCIAEYRHSKNPFYTQQINISVPKNIAVKKPKRKKFVMGKSIRSIVEKVSRKYSIDPALIHAVIARESAYKQYARSHAGAMGLMQLMPNTAKYLGLKKSEYYDKYKNVDAGTRYLKEQLHTFDGNVALALAAYNAGPGAVRKYNGIPPYQETQKYVPAVLGYYRYFKAYLGEKSHG